MEHTTELHAPTPRGLGTRVLDHRAGSAGSRPDRPRVLAGPDLDARLPHLTGITPALGATALDASTAGHLFGLLDGVSSRERLLALGDGAALR